MTINSAQKMSKSELSSGGKRPFKVSSKSTKKSIERESPLVWTNRWRLKREPPLVGANGCGSIATSLNQRTYSQTGVPIYMFTNSIRQFYVAIEKEEWKIDTLCDLYETLTITQAIIYFLFHDTKYVS